MKQLVLVIGAANPSTFGRVKVFQFVNDAWLQIGNTLTGLYDDFFGRRVSLNDAGNIIAASSKNPTKVFQLTNGM